MKKLLGFFKPYIWQSILGPLFKLLEATFELLVPFVVAAIFYFIFNWLVSAGMTRVEEKLNYYR